MKKIFISLVIGGILGGIVGFAGGILVFPYWFPPPPANEQVADRSSKTVLAAGTFIHANPSDPVHYGSGGVEILKSPDGERIVYLKPDFNVGPGPRYHVYLVDRANIKSNDDFEAAKVTDLGQIRSFKGSQIYQIPGSVDLTPIKSVVVWCKEFNVLISPATLKPGT
jgi:hypothetical protein